MPKIPKYTYSVVWTTAACVWFLSANFVWCCPRLVLRSCEQLLPVACFIPCLLSETLLSAVSFPCSQAPVYQLSLVTEGMLLGAPPVASFSVYLSFMIHFLRWWTRVEYSIRDIFLMVIYSFLLCWEFLISTFVLLLLLFLLLQNLVLKWIPFSWPVVICRMVAFCAFLHLSALLYISFHWVSYTSLMCTYTIAESALDTIFLPFIAQSRLELSVTFFIFM